MLSGFYEYSPAIDLKTSFVRELSDRPNRGRERKSGHLCNILPSMRDLLSFLAIHFTRQPQNNTRYTLLGRWRGHYLDRIGTITKNTAHAIQH